MSHELVLSDKIILILMILKNDIPTSLNLLGSFDSMVIFLKHSYLQFSFHFARKSWSSAEADPGSVNGGGGGGGRESKFLDAAPENRPKKQKSAEKGGGGAAADSPPPPPPWIRH